MAVGRFAPTPSGDLHVGNLRTALLAWLFARSAGSRFVLRVDDLDPATARDDVAAAQLDDLRALGLDWDGPIVHQRDRTGAHGQAIADLVARGLTYSCYCSRREILEASAAPHGQAPEGAYPGTCRDLSRSEQAAREAAGRRPALRLRTDGELVTVVDRLHGPVSARVDDVVLRRGDGVPAYNLAVVVDDAAQEIEEVVRGDDLRLSTPRQVHLARLLGLPEVGYAHVPLVLAPGGARLAKRDGAVTLADRRRLGEPPEVVRSWLAASLALAEPGEVVSMATLLDRFDPDRLPREPWTLAAEML
ncbi:MAG: tRNA glutamyl-Q(34) synthetase GluQRS [Acidimicrobiales bacterium]